MKVLSVCPQSFGSNCYLIISGSHAYVVDPSVSVQAILNAAAEQDVCLDGILLTHGHFDHMLSLDLLRDTAGLEAAVHKDDADFLTDSHKNAFFTFFGKERTFRPAERLLSDGEKIPMGEESVTVLHTPGHTPGSVCFLCGDTLITGDTLFAESFGRCDLYGGSPEEMSRSLASLRELDPHLRICPGHGADSVLGGALDNVAYLL